MKFTFILTTCLFMINVLCLQGNAFEIVTSEEGLSQYRFQAHELVTLKGAPNKINLTAMLKRHGVDTRGLNLVRVKMIIDGKVRATFETHGWSSKKGRHDVDLSYCRDGRDYFLNGQYYRTRSDFENRRCYIELDDHHEGGRGHILGVLEVSSQNRIFFAQDFNTRNLRWIISLTHPKRYAFKGMHVTVSR